MRGGGIHGAKDVVQDVFQSVTGAAVGEQIRFFASHQVQIAAHDIQIGADVRSKVSLVDHQQVGLGNSLAAFAGDFVAGGDVR